jgi:hypothetical protein
MKKKVLLLGDSHTIMHKPLHIKMFHSIHCGACTATGLLTLDSKTQSYQTIRNILMENNPDEVQLGFLFGEIDCRVLVYFQHIAYNIPMWEIISRICHRYMAAIDFFRGMGGFKIHVHGIIPACQQSNEYGVPHYGDLKTRAEINYHFNQIMQNMCHVYDVPYFDLFDYQELRDSATGATHAEFLLPDLVHIDPTKCRVNSYYSDWMEDNL